MTSFIWLIQMMYSINRDFHIIVGCLSRLKLWSQNRIINLVLGVGVSSKVSGPCGIRKWWQVPDWSLAQGLLKNIFYPKMFRKFYFCKTSTFGNSVKDKCGPPQPSSKRVNRVEVLNFSKSYILSSQPTGSHRARDRTQHNRLIFKINSWKSRMESGILREPS